MQYHEGVSKLLSPRSNTEYHRVFLLIINNLKSSLCYSVYSVVSFDTVPFCLFVKLITEPLHVSVSRSSGMVEIWLSLQIFRTLQSP